MYSSPTVFDEDKYAWANLASVAAAEATWTANSQAGVDGMAQALVNRGMADTVTALGGVTDATFGGNEQTLLNNLLAAMRDKGVIGTTVVSPFRSPFVEPTTGRYCGGSGIANFGGTYGATEQGKVNDMLTACRARGLIATD